MDDLTGTPPIIAEPLHAPNSLTGSRWDRIATSRWLPFALAGLSMLLAAPSLRAGWLADDYVHRAKLLGSSRFEGLLGSRTDLFAFFDGIPEHTQRLMDIGLLPWWTDPQIRGAFWRPVTVATHLLDYALWPHSAVLMHAQSVLWLGLLVLAVTFVYRRFLDPRTATLAALLYAIDDARGTPVGFLANRNAMMATLFGLLALLAHDRWRRTGRKWAAVAGALLFIASLLSGEIGLATTAYLLGYAGFVDRSSTNRRWTALIPYAAIVVAWRTTWSALGYGIEGSDPYVDPLTEPLRFVGQVALRAPALLLGQWFLPPSDLSIVLSGSQAWLAATALALVVIIAVIVGRVLARDRHSGFWVTGMFLSVPPVCAVFSSDRLLSFVGIGAMALLARFLVAVRYSSPRAPARILGTALIVVHGVIAPVGLVLRAAYPAGPPIAYDHLLVQTAFDVSVEEQDLIVVNAPSAFHAGFLPLMRDTAGLPAPRHMRVLAPGLPAVTIRRPDANSLEVRPEDGYLNWVFDRLFRSQRRGFRPGDRVDLTGLTAQIMELTHDGRPALVRFEFSVPLEHPSLKWLQWTNGEFVPFAPPPMEATIELRPSVP